MTSEDVQMSKTRHKKEPNPHKGHLCLALQHTHVTLIFLAYLHVGGCDVNVAEECKYR